MSDIPELEQQLVAAARRQSLSGPVMPRWLVPIGAAAAAYALAIVAITSIVAEPERPAASSGTAMPPGDLQALVGQTLTATEDEPSCALVTREAQSVQRAPSFATLERFTVLARPQTAFDRDGSDPSRAQKGSRYLAGTVRRVPGPENLSVQLVVTDGPLVAYTQDAEKCAEVREREFERVAVPAGSEFLIAGHAALGELIIERPDDDTEWVEMTLLNADSTPNQATAAPAADVARGGLYRTVIRGSGTSEERWFTGIVPNPVVNVKVTTEAGDSTVSVDDNTFFVTWPMDTGSALAIEWLDRYGETIRSQRCDVEIPSEVRCP